MRRKISIILLFVILAASLYIPSSSSENSMASSEQQRILVISGLQELGEISVKGIPTSIYGLPINNTSYYGIVVSYSPGNETSYVTRFFVKDGTIDKEHVFDLTIKGRKITRLFPASCYSLPKNTTYVFYAPSTRLSTNNRSSLLIYGVESKPRSFGMEVPKELLKPIYLPGKVNWVDMLQGKNNTLYIFYKARIPAIINGTKTEAISYYIASIDEKSFKMKKIIRLPVLLKLGLNDKDFLSWLGNNITIEYDSQRRIIVTSTYGYASNGSGPYFGLYAIIPSNGTINNVTILHALFDWNGDLVMSNNYTIPGVYWGRAYESGFTTPNTCPFNLTSIIMLHDNAVNKYLISVDPFHAVVVAPVRIDFYHMIGAGIDGLVVAYSDGYIIDAAGYSKYISDYDTGLIIRISFIYNKTMALALLGGAGEPEVHILQLKLKQVEITPTPTTTTTTKTITYTTPRTTTHKTTRTTSTTTTTTKTIKSKTTTKTKEKTTTLPIPLKDGDTLSYEIHASAKGPNGTLSGTVKVKLKVKFEKKYINLTRQEVSGKREVKELLVAGLHLTDLFDLSIGRKYMIYTPSDLSPRIAYKCPVFNPAGDSKTIEGSLEKISYTIKYKCSYSNGVLVSLHAKAASKEGQLKWSINYDVYLKSTTIEGVKISKGGSYSLTMLGLIGGIAALAVVIIIIFLARR